MKRETKKAGRGRVKVCTFTAVVEATVQVSDTDLSVLRAIVDVVQFFSYHAHY